MPTAIENHVSGMLQHRGQIVDSFGKDLSRRITYQFNQQGFRSSKNFDYTPDFAFFGCSSVFGIGVAEHDIFASRFQNSHNYGLAGTYDNHDVMIVLEKFLNSDLYTGTNKIAVVWHSRDSDCLENFYHLLKGYPILHFFCGESLGLENCYKVPKDLDNDVSGTHPGPMSHEFFYRLLCALFDRS